MATVFIKGLKEPYQVSKSHAEQINLVFVDSNIPSHHKLSIGPLSFTKSEIKLVVLDEERPIGMEEWRDKVSIWDKEWNKNVAQDVRTKAERNVENYYPLWWYAYTGNLETKKNEEAKNLAEQFFKENPNRTVVNYTIWRSLFPRSKPNDEIPMSGVMKLAGIRILEKHLAEDIEKSSFRKVPKDTITTNDIPF